MNSDRIKELQFETAYPESHSVKRALLQVWNECQQENNIELAALRKENEEHRATLNRALNDFRNGTWTEETYKTIENLLKP